MSELFSLISLMYKKILTTLQRKVNHFYWYQSKKKMYFQTYKHYTCIYWKNNDMYKIMFYTVQYNRCPQNK